MSKLIYRIFFCYYLSLTLLDLKSAEYGTPSPHADTSSSLQRSSRPRPRTRIKKTNSSTISFTMAGLLRGKQEILLTETGFRSHTADRSSDCDNIILHPGTSRLRERRTKVKQKKKGLNFLH